MDKYTADVSKQKDTCVRDTEILQLPPLQEDKQIHTDTCVILLGQSPHLRHKLHSKSSRRHSEGSTGRGLWDEEAEITSTPATHHICYSSSLLSCHHPQN